MPPVPDRSTFESAYAGQAPWDIGKPQPAFLDVADRITGSVLDAGCGTGDNALYFAGRGCKVTGIDFLEEPIRRARRKAAERGVQGGVRGSPKPMPSYLPPGVEIDQTQGEVTRAVYGQQLPIR
jgi:SAM-dependent methyltransferase